MIVYVESNFVLELALEQEQAQYAEAIFGLAEQSSLTLVIPSFALSEPFSTIELRKRNRERLSAELAGQLRQLRRSALHRDLVARSEPAVLSLGESYEREKASLQAVVRRIAACGSVIALDTAVFQQATRHQGQYGLSPPDAIIYASVLAHVQQAPSAEPKYLVSKDKGFNDPGLIAQLRSYNCHFSGDFQVAAALIRNSIS